MYAFDTKGIINRTKKDLKYQDPLYFDYLSFDVAGQLPYFGMRFNLLLCFNDRRRR